MLAMAPKFNAWRAAERENQLLEREMLKGRLRRAQDPSIPTATDDERWLTERRELTHALFVEAMAELDGLARSMR